jgi:hypothetical protein
MFCLPCIVIYQYSRTNKTHLLYSVYYELTAPACCEHYLLIFRRRCINNSWYTACVLCRLAATRVGVPFPLQPSHYKAISVPTFIKFYHCIDYSFIWNYTQICTQKCHVVCNSSLLHKLQCYNTRCCVRCRCYATRVTSVRLVWQPPPPTPRANPVGWAYHLFT